ALLVGLSRLPRSRRPGEGRGAARDRPHRCRDHRGVPPRTRAVDVGHRGPPPRSEILRRLKPVDKWVGMTADAMGVRFSPTRDRAPDPGLIDTLCESTKRSWG